MQPFIVEFGWGMDVSKQLDVEWHRVVKESIESHPSLETYELSNPPNRYYKGI